MAEALTPVLRDLENSGSEIPDVRDSQWSSFGLVTAMLYSRDGSGQGVRWHGEERGRAVVRTGRPNTVVRKDRWLL